MKSGNVLLGLLVCLLLGTHAWAAISMVDDVTNTAQNEYGGNRYAGGNGTGSMVLDYISNTTTAKPFDNQSYAIQLDYNAPPGAYLWFVEPLVTTHDLSAFNYLSFWVKGAAGGEGFQVRLNNGTFATILQVSQCLPHGITTDWQKVVIPFSVMEQPADPVRHTPILVRSSISLIEFIIANNGTDDGGRLVGNSSGTVYIDNITFGTSAAPVWVSKYDCTWVPDGTTTTAVRGSITGFPAGTAYYTGVTFTSSPFSMAYTLGGGASRNLVHYLYRNAVGAQDGTINRTDFSGCTDIQFDIKGTTGSENPALRLMDVGWVSNSVSLAPYITTNFHTVTLPFTMYSAPNLTQLAELDFDDTSVPSGTVYVDNVVAVDTSVPAAPTAMTFNGSAVADGFHLMTQLGTVGVTAPSITADGKMERVRFEYSANGGATWVLIADDYATANGKTSYATSAGAWDLTALPIGTYLLKATAYHVGGTSSVLTHTVNLVGTPTVTPSITYTPTQTPTLTQSATITSTPTVTATASISSTLTVSATTTPTPTITATASISATKTHSATVTTTPTVTVTPTKTVTFTQSPTVTVSPTPSIAFTSTITLTPTITATPFVQEMRVLRNSFNPAIGQVLPLEARMPSRGKLRIVIYNRLGDKIIELNNQDAGPGTVALAWDGKNSDGHAVASGVYVIYTEMADQTSKHLVAVIH
jgi:hypothetical protein